MTHSPDQLLVSIIIPVYNSEKYLADTLNSAINQSWPNKEIIVVDDGSTDRSLLIAMEYEKYGIQIVRRQNGGASAARNTGLNKSKGDFIQFLDADDLLSNDKIEMQVLALKENMDKIAVCNTIHFPEKDNHLQFFPPTGEDDYIYNTGNPVDFLIKLWGGENFSGWMIQPNAWLTPAHLIEKAGRWDESLSLDDDGEFFTRILLQSSGVVKTEGKNYYRKFQRSKLSLSGRSDVKAYESALRSLMLKKEHLLRKTTSDGAKRALYNLFTDLAMKTYPKYPAVYNAIFANLEQLPRYNYLPPLGGKLINTISRIFGFKFALRLQNLYR